MVVQASRNGPAAPVLAGPVFSKREKIKVHYYKKEVIKKSDIVIFGLVRLILLGIMGEKGIQRDAKLSAAHALCLQGILLC